MGRIIQAQEPLPCGRSGLGKAGIFRQDQEAIGGCGAALVFQGIVKSKGPASGQCRSRVAAEGLHSTFSAISSCRCFVLWSYPTHGNWVPDIRNRMSSCEAMGGLPLSSCGESLCDGKSKAQEHATAFWRDVVAIKSTGCSSRGPRFSSQTSSSSSKWSLTLVLRGQMSSSDFLKHQVWMWYIDMRVDRTHVYIK